MKYLLLSIFAALFALSSCEEEDGGYSRRENAQNHVRYKITCNNPLVHVKIDGGKPIYFMGEYEEEYVTKDYFTGVRLSCYEDPLATIRCLLYVNGKLVVDRSAQLETKIEYKLK